MKKYNKTGFRAETQKKMTMQGQFEEYLDSLIIGQDVLITEDEKTKIGTVIQKNKTCVFVKTDVGTKCASIGELITGTIKIGGKSDEIIDNRTANA